MSILKISLAVNLRQMIQVKLGDLTEEASDAIVNAANTHLEHGGGVAGAIVRRGGYEIQEESRAWVELYGKVPVGQVAVTAAGKLACQYIIHAVGPIWRGGSQNEEGLLRDAALNSLLEAHEMGLASISLPAISSGIFGFPKERCAAIMIETAFDFCAQFPESSLQEICFTNIDELTTDLFEAALLKAQKDRFGSS